MECRYTIIIFNSDLFVPLGKIEGPCYVCRHFQTLHIQARMNTWMESVKCNMNKTTAHIDISKPRSSEILKDLLDSETEMVYKCPHLEYKWNRFISAHDILVTGTLL